MTKIDLIPDDVFIKKYDQLKSSRKMAQFFNTNKTAILNHAKKIGYDVHKNQQGKLSDKDKQEIIDAYQEKTSAELAKQYNVSRGMITKLWYDNNLKGKTVTRNPKQDLTGQHFGYLIAEYPTEKRNKDGSILWYCKCNCGRQNCKGYAYASSTQLKNKKIISCGVIGKENLNIGHGLNFHDLTGQRFGKLTIIKRAEDKILASGRAEVQWLCKCDCGNETIVLASNLANGNTQSCGLCNEKSHGNIKIAQLLDKNNIPYEREKRFDTCKDKTYLPFDFYVNNKYLIEYDGKQHFDENSFFDYEGTHKRDLIKTTWCKENHIPLIRIPYTHYNDLCINDLLLQTSSFVEK